MAPRNSAEPKADTAADRKIVVTRVFDAPRDLVWRVWTEPRHVMRWWGPKEFSSPACRMDFRVGGTYHFCMRSPDGKDYWSTGVYTEIVPRERIVCTDCFADETGRRVSASFYGMGDDWPEEMGLTVSFEEVGGKTRLTVAATGHPAGRMSELAEAGWGQSLDKVSRALERTLQVRMIGSRELESRRLFDAPRELVFRAHVDPSMIPQWWGPLGSATRVDRLDARPGGAWRFVVLTGGTEQGFHGEFREVLPHERIAWTFEWEGMPGHVCMETMTFEDRGEATLLSVRSVFGTPEDRDGTVANGMEQGAAETYERLEALLASR